MFLKFPSRQTANCIKSRLYQPNRAMTQNFLYSSSSTNEGSHKSTQSDAPPEEDEFTPKYVWWPRLLAVAGGLSLTFIAFNTWNESYRKVCNF